MQRLDSLLHLYKQNSKLPILLVSHDFGHVPPEITSSYGLTHRKTHYFFIFILEGSTNHRIDLNEFDIQKNQLLFILPHQIHQLPTSRSCTNYFKLGFDDTSLSLLPKQYPFLINPLNNQKIQLTEAVVARLKSLFEILAGLLSSMDTNPELILAHLNSLLTEINEAYFATDKTPTTDKLSKFINFKLYVENNFTDSISIQAIAEELGLNTNSLYNMVKHYTGLSPKAFITNRLMLEAKRRLYYSESSSIKELAYDLGFNDPEYFSRLFKKTTGQTIAAFSQDLSGN